MMYGLTKITITGRTAYWDEIKAGIEQCSHFLFVISPASIAEDSGALTELYHAASIRPLPSMVLVMSQKTDFRQFPIVITPGRYQIHDFVHQPYDMMFGRVLIALEPSTSKPKPQTIDSDPPKQLQPPATHGLPLLEWCYIPSGKTVISGVVCDVDAFWIAKYPVTVDQFEIFVKENGYKDEKYWSKRGWQWKGERKHPESWTDPKFRTSKHPVVNVNWYEARAFTHWMNYKYFAGMSPPPVGSKLDLFGLPTEEQWQRAAQGDDQRKYPWGDKFEIDLCNSKESGFDRTTPVNELIETFEKGRNGAS